MMKDIIVIPGEIIGDGNDLMPFIDVEEKEPTKKKTKLFQVYVDKY